MTDSSSLGGAVRTNPIETASGVILILVGGVLTLAVDLWGVRFAGYAVSTVGTLLISWALTRAWVAHQHNQDLLRALQAISRPLSTVVTQLNQAAVHAVSDPTVEVQPSLVLSCVQHLYGVLSELHGIIGSPISIDDVVAIKGRLETLSHQLTAASVSPAHGAHADDSAGAGPALLAKAVEEINSIKLQLESNVSRRTRQFTQEVPECPSCHTRLTVVMLGTLPGDSAVATCAGCGQRYHVHRGPDGTPFTRFPGGVVGEAPPAFKFACPRPECGAHLTINLQRDAITPQKRFCLGCYAQLLFNPATQTATVLRSPEAPLRGTLREEAGVTYLTCPQCQAERRTFALRDNVYYSVCAVHDSLVSATREHGDLNADGAAAGSTAMPTPQKNPSVA